MFDQMDIADPSRQATKYVQDITEEIVGFRPKLRASRYLQDPMLIDLTRVWMVHFWIPTLRTSAKVQGKSVPSMPKPT